MTRRILALAAAPVLGLAFVTFLPIAGFVVTIWAIASRIRGLIQRTGRSLSCPTAL